MAEEVFRNEPAADFSQAAERERMSVALTRVRASLGKTYPLFIDGNDVPGRPTASSINPARPSEVIGRVCQASADDLDAAVAAARGAFSTWRETDPRSRAAYLLRAASALRSRAMEASATLVLEVGKPWDQASHDVSEAIDFLEYYAREMVRLGTPVQHHRGVPTMTLDFSVRRTGIDRPMEPERFAERRRKPRLQTAYRGDSQKGR